MFVGVEEGKFRQFPHLSFSAAVISWREPNPAETTGSLAYGAVLNSYLGVKGRGREQKAENRGSFLNQKAVGVIPGLKTEGRWHIRQSGAGPRALSHSLWIPGATLGHPHHPCQRGGGNEAGGSVEPEEAGPGYLRVWGSSRQLSAWVLRATRNHWLGVTASSPKKLSRPFSKDCSVSSLRISHWFLGPGQSMLKVGRRAVSFSNPGKWRRGCLCLALLLVCVSPCTCVGAQRWGPG